MSYKLLKVIFVILLLVTIAEAGYYVIVLKNTTKFQSNSIPISANTEITTISLIPTVIPLVQNTIDESDPLVANFLKSDPYIFIKDKNNQEGKNIVVTIEQKGIIADIQHTNSDQRSAFIQVNSSEGKKLFKLVLKETFKYYKNINNYLTPIEVTELKKGDSVSLKLSEDLLNPSIKTTEFILHD